MLKIVYTKIFEKDLSRLDSTVAKRIILKISELGLDSHNFQFLGYSPKGMEKLCKLRVGDYRVLFWVDNKEKIITLYSVEHRNKIYKKL